MLEGYIAFLLLLFLPGAALLELLGIGGDLPLRLRLAMWYGLGISVDVLILVVRTSGLLVGGQYLEGIYPDTIYLVLVASVATILVSATLRRRLPHVSRPTRTDALLLSLVLFQGVLILLHFVTFPVFPEYQSIDFSQHVNIVTDIQNGHLLSLPGGILYFGVHLLLASFLALAGGEPLVMTQYGVGILAAFSPLLVYAAAVSLTKSERASLVATFIYVFGAYIWFDQLFDTGLYANFFGFLLIMTLLSWLARSEGPGKLKWVPFVVVVAAGYFSHYTFVTVLPAFLVLPLWELATTRRVSRHTILLLAILYVPAIAGAVVYPNIVGFLLQFQSASGGATLQGSTPLSAALSFYPFLQYMVYEVGYDVGAVLLLLMAGYALCFVSKRWGAPLTLLAVWLLLVAISAPISQAAWRFSYVGLAPLTILAAVGFDSMAAPGHRTLSIRRAKLHRRRYALNRRTLAAILLIALVAGSWGYSVVRDAVTQHSASAAQDSEYDSMLWIKQNLPAGSLIISVTDPNYRYLDLIAGQQASFALMEPPRNLIFLAANSSEAYAIVTQYTTIHTTQQQLSSLVEQYSGSSNFQLLYQNADVRIYRILPIHA